MSNVFVSDICLNSIKEYVCNYLGTYCIKEGNYLYINKEIYKKYEINNKTEEFIKEITGEKIINIKRIAKNLIIELSNEKILIVHLKMTGQLVFVDKKKNKTLGGHPIVKSFTDDLPNKHTVIIFNLNNGTRFYNDVRMFGYVLYFKNMGDARNHGLFKNIGFDPFDKNFTLEYFKKEIHFKHRPHRF